MIATNSDKPAEEAEKAQGGGQSAASTSAQNTSDSSTSTNTGTNTLFGGAPAAPAATSSFPTPKPFGFGLQTQTTSISTPTPTSIPFGLPPPTPPTTQPSGFSAFQKPAETTAGGGATNALSFGSSSTGEKKDSTSALQSGSGSGFGGFGALNSKPLTGFTTDQTTVTAATGFTFGKQSQSSTAAVSTQPATTSQTPFGGFGVSTAPKSPFGGFATANQTANQTTNQTINQTTNQTTNQATSTASTVGFTGFGQTSTKPLGFGSFGNPSSTGMTNTSGFVGFGKTSASSTAASTQPATTTQPSQSSQPSFGGFGGFGGFGANSKTNLGLGTTATTAAQSSFGGFQTNSTTTSTNSGIGSVPTTPALTSAPSLFGTSGISLGGVQRTTVPSSPFGNSLKPSVLTTTTASTLQTGFNPTTTTSPSQSSNVLSRLGGLPSTQATTPKPFSSFNIGTTATTSAPSVFPLSASTTAASISATKPPSIIPQSTSAGFFRTSTSSSITSQFRPTLQTSLQTPASTISFPRGTTTTVATTQSSTSTTESIPTSSTWLKNSNIETIINRWKKDLDASLKKFHSQASELREFDHKIIENSGRIVRLEEESSKADLLHSEIESGLENIARRQDELEKMLSEYEVKFSEPVLDSTRPLDKEREKNYDMAEEINQELGDMSQVLSTIITDVNRNVIKSSVNDELNGNQDGSDKEDIEDPMDEVIKILNSHLTSLQWIDSQANQLTQNVQNAQQLLIQSQNELNAQQQQNGTNNSPI